MRPPLLSPPARLTYAASLLATLMLLAQGCLETRALERPEERGDGPAWTVGEDAPDGLFDGPDMAPDADVPDPTDMPMPDDDDGVGPITSTCFEVENAQGSGDTFVFDTLQVGEEVETLLSLRNCGDFPTSIERVTLEGDADAFELVSPPAQTTIPAMESRAIAVIFGPPRRGTFEATLKIDTGTTIAELTLRGEGEITCPTARVDIVADVEDGLGPFDPLTPLELDARASVAPDGSSDGLTYEWAVLGRPDGSAAQLTPTGTEGLRRITLDMVGSYRVEVQVVDAQGRRSCAPDEVTFDVVPLEEFYVELTWETPLADPEAGDVGSDLDLHYRNSEGAWNTAPYDIFWENPTADWGRPGDADDPQLVRDERETANGPELLVHEKPERGRTFRLGVYVLDSRGFGPSDATARIYIQGALGVETTRRDLYDDDFWLISLHEWPTFPVRLLDRIYIDGFPFRD